MRCIYIEPAIDTLTDGGKVKIRFKGDDEIYEVNRTSISPIPVTEEELNSKMDSEFNNPEKRRTDWHFESTLPYTVHYQDKGHYFEYTNKKIQETNNPPIPVDYMSDIEATHKGFETMIDS